ncbi:MAG: C40 family peptidase [Burkholderiaceae bacterium]|nr:C40 family peptidase [Roseateles sp.]MBV8468615.1 C40 family peptidase [Burkholderiaceae bacterium]
MGAAGLGLGLFGAAGQALAQQAQQANAPAPALTPPPGTVTGAYGQSLQLSHGSSSAPGLAQNTGSSVAAGTTGNAPGDAVSRFLQERGLLSSDSDGPLLNRVRNTASDLVMSAMNFLGVPYRRGGNSIEGGFDCSGFTRHIFEMSVGMVLPHRADEQAHLSSLIPVKQDELKPGDLVFFNTMRRTFSHVGIYVGDGKFIHSPRVGSAVRVEDMREAYWAKRFTGARRAELGSADSATSGENRSSLR